MKGGVPVGLRWDGCKEGCSAGAGAFGCVRERPWGRVMAEQSLQKQSGGFWKSIHSRHCKQSKGQGKSYS